MAFHSVGNGKSSHLTFIFFRGVGIPLTSIDSVLNGITQFAEASDHVFAPLPDVHCLLKYGSFFTDLRNERLTRIPLFERIDVSCLHASFGMFWPSMGSRSTMIGRLSHESS